MCARISAGVLFLVLLQAQIFLYAVASLDHKTIAEYTRSRRETPSGGCQLPEHPQNGVYTSPQCLSGDETSECRNLPGTTVPNYWILKYSCGPNYSLSSEVEFSICNNGTWQNPLHCLRNSISTTKCGLSTSPSTLIPLIVNGSTTHQGEYPWVAGLYKKRDEKWELLCAGTLISPHIVVTAAHCVVDEISNNGVIAPDNIKIGLGKYYRDFDKEEASSVISDVREIVVPQHFIGRAAYYALDIAILDLKKRVPVTAFVMPACVHWNSLNANFFGSTGNVAGWGVTENETISDVLLSAELTPTEFSACINQLRPAFRRLLTHDKFCAASKDGGQINRLDSGVGLTYLENGQHFLAGLASTKIVGEAVQSLFTNIQNQEVHAWLEEQKTRLERLHKEDEI
ncbi:clotting factor C-like [Homalodisca vitripennis]|uniref:clotting factor C-like n=1 Tax=Homalodisca vitripennis TaxID=197043 RepID=UPI001EEAA964|nr:clotting factor C-like [Homalodisca vitripennis]